MLLRRSKPPFHHRSAVLGLLVLVVLTAACGPTQPAPNGGTKTNIATSTASPVTSRATPTRPAATPTTTPTPSSRISIDPASLQGTTIQFWHAWIGPEEQTVAGLVRQFNDSNEWGIRVETHLQLNFDELSENVSTAISSPSPPDVVAAYSYQFLHWNMDGQTLPIDLSNYVNDPVWGINLAEQNSFYPVFWQTNQDNNRYGVPAQRSGSLLYYNQTWAEELGFTTPPKTTQDFEQQACAAAQAYQRNSQGDNDGTGGWIITTDYAAALSWMAAFGAEFTRPTGGYRFNTPQVESALRFLRQLYEKGCAWLPDSEIPDYEFANRQGLFVAGTIAGIPYQESAFADASSTDIWVVLPFPAFQGQGSTIVYGPDFSILRSSPEKQLASWLFIRWMLQPENQAALSRAGSTYPLSPAIADQVLATSKPMTQWLDAVSFLSGAKSEPTDPSWETVRWAVSDITTQLFRWYFTLDQLPASVRLLEQTASELYKNAH